MSNASLARAAKKRAEAARTNAVLAAKRVGGELFDAVLDQAEMALIRKHMIGAMGEEAYWNAVREEIES